MEYIQAFISNFTYFNYLYELSSSNGSDDNMSSLIEDAKYNCVYWTVPRWSHEGDIILFMYSKKAIQRINSLEKDVYTLCRGINQNKCLALINDAKEQYKKYGGKIVGFGKLNMDPELGGSVVGTRTLANISDVYILENPLPCSKFTSFLRISQGGVTPVKEALFQAAQAVK